MTDAMIETRHNGLKTLLMAYEQGQRACEALVGLRRRGVPPRSNVAMSLSSHGWESPYHTTT